MHQMSRRRTFSFLVSSLLAGAVCAPGMSQTAGLGGVGGAVRDTTGALVPGTSVTIINMGTGASRTVTTDSEGFYSVSFLQPGTYEVIAGGGAFGKVDRKNLSLTVGAPITVDVTLPAATVSSEVTVSSEQPLKVRR
jgi:hypothetical protein